MLSFKKRKELRKMMEDELWRVFEEDPDVLSNMLFYMKENLNDEEREYLDSLDFDIQVLEMNR